MMSDGIIGVAGPLEAVALDAIEPADVTESPALAGVDASFFAHPSINASIIASVANDAMAVLVEPLRVLCMVRSSRACVRLRDRRHARCPA